MKYSNINITIALVILMTIVGCRKDTYEEIPRFIPPEIEVEVETGLIGLVRDESGGAVSGAMVRAGAAETTTDVNGYFSIPRVILDGRGSVVSISKAGHFTAIKRVFPTERQPSMMQVALRSRELTATVEASSGGMIEVDNAVSITLPGAAYVDRSGTSYTGPVRVYATYYDPTAGETFISMPGDLTGRDMDDNLVQLGTYGMIGVELEGSNGQALQLSGKDADISMQIPAEIVASAPQEIPLWHFDEGDGLWIEEGLATKVGDRYEGSVSHFSFWNCDRPWPAIKLTMRLLDPDGFPIIGGAVVLKAEGVGAASGVSASSGVICGYVPAGVELTLVIYSCGELVVEQVIGSFDQDADIGDVTLDYLVRTTTVTGRVIDCIGQPATGAYGLLRSSDFGAQLIYPDVDGNFVTTVTSCSTIDNEVQFFDRTNLTTSTAVSIDVNSTLNSLGDIVICDQLDEFVRYSFDGGDQLLVTDVVVDLIDDNYLTISTFQSQEGGIQLSTPAVLGINTPSEIQLNRNEPNGPSVARCDESFSCSDFTIDLISIGGAAGDYITGTFSGVLQNIDDNTPNPNTPESQVEGQFRVKVDYAYQGASVAGLIWFDSDEDGQRTSSDPLFQPNGSMFLTNNLTDNEQVIKAVPMDQDGRYTINRLRPGTYTMFSNPGGFGFTLTGTDVGDDQTDNDFSVVNSRDIYELSVGEGELITNIDAGYLTDSQMAIRVTHTGCEMDTRLRVDVLQGVPPYRIIVNGAEVAMTTMTNVELPLAPDVNYDIEVIDAVGASESSSYYLPSNAGRITVDVFEDINGDGDYTATIDQLVGGVEIRLYDSAGGLISTLASTDQLYVDTFTEMPEGDYTIDIELPSGYKYAQLGSGFNGNVVDPVTGQSSIIELPCNNTRYAFVGIEQE